MSPQSAFRGPVERGFVFVPVPGTRVARSERRRLSAKVICQDSCLMLGTPSWLTPLRDRSGQSSQPLWQGTR